MSALDDGNRPPVIDDATIELMIRAAKALVVVVYAVVILTFVMLSLGFVLLLAGASPEAGFVDWVYRNTEQAMQPFRGMFPVRELDGRSVFDASLLFAATLYGFVAIGLHALVVYLSERARFRHLAARRAARARAASIADSEQDALGRASQGPELDPDHRFGEPSG